MGMFDTVRVKAGLPEGSPCDGDTDFQTKGLHCLLEHYEVRADGRLVKVRAAADDDGGESLPCEPGPLVFHGDLDLLGDGRDGRLCRYRARFTEGFLTSVKDVTQPEGGGR